MAEIHSAIARRRGAAGAALALALAAGALTACGDAGATITRLTVGTPGPDPYTLAAGTDTTGVKPRPKAGGTATGDSPGLYGGTRQDATCDPAKLVAFLQANPEKARAWARTQGIAAEDIPGYVAQLTPVLLRTDTLVTNHGFRNGEATRGPAVLQAGMGVLVNGRGVPAVKCNCGNPLTPPDRKISPGNASYTGRSWPGFQERKVTRIEPSDAKKGPIAVFVLVDPEGAMGFERPRATEGEADGPPAPLPPTETEVTPDGSPSPGDSGTATPGAESPGTEPPGTNPPGTDPTGTDPTGTGDPAGTGPPGTPPSGAEGGGPPSSTGVTSSAPGTGGGGEPGVPGGGGTQSPVSLPPPEGPAPVSS